MKKKAKPKFTKKKVIKALPKKSYKKKKTNKTNYRYGRGKTECELLDENIENLKSKIKGYLDKRGICNRLGFDKWICKSKSEVYDNWNKTITDIEKNNLGKTCDKETYTALVLLLNEIELNINKWKEEIPIRQSIQPFLNSSSSLNKDNYKLALLNMVNSNPVYDILMTLYNHTNVTEEQLFDIIHGGHVFIQNDNGEFYNNFWSKHPLAKNRISSHYTNNKKYLSNNSHMYVNGTLGLIPSCINSVVTLLFGKTRIPYVKGFTNNGKKEYSWLQLENAPYTSTSKFGIFNSIDDFRHGIDATYYILSGRKYNIGPCRWKQKTDKAPVILTYIKPHNNLIINTNSNNSSNNTFGTPKSNRSTPSPKTSKTNNNNSGYFNNSVINMSRYFN